jgi:hypothetical protein
MQDRRAAVLVAVALAACTNDTGNGAASANGAAGPLVASSEAAVPENWEAWLVGRWGRDGGCDDRPVEFRADGRFFASDDPIMRRWGVRKEGERYRLVLSPSANDDAYLVRMRDGTIRLDSLDGRETAKLIRC